MRAAKMGTIVAGVAVAAAVIACGGAVASGGAVAPSATRPAHARAGAAGGAPATAAGAAAAPRSSAPAASAGAAVVFTRPPIIVKHIPFPAKRKREMRAYALRHYGIDSYRLTRPRVIVEHYTVNDSVRATFDTFAPDVPDVELHELPGVCSHYVVARNGQIFELVPVTLMCRHTVGLNYTAIGIEHVGRSDQDILGNPRQLRASLRLTTWLRCRFHIGVDNVIGHNESLSSPYHHEDVARLRTQTHADWTHPDMQIYRAKLRAQRC